jgi:hypothetical protein
MKPADRKSVRLLTNENWHDSIRTRRSSGISMGARIEQDTDSRYRVIYGFPQKGFGAEEIFDSLDKALSWANHDGGGVMIFVEDRPLG